LKGVALAPSIATLEGDVQRDTGFQRTASTGVFVNGQEIATLPFITLPHRHGNQTIISVVNVGTTNVFAGGKQIARADDSAQCGHRIITYSPNVKVP
tara:strand:+ start:2254 stop:2544 length:291 start_codon:yes stop_codon:yes gene_type:complete